MAASKKINKVNLENKKGLFFQIGLTISLLLANGAFAINVEKIESDPIFVLIEEMYCIYRIVEPTPPQSEAITQAIINNPRRLRIVPNDFEVLTTIEIPEFFEEMEIPERE